MMARMKIWKVLFALLFVAAACNGQEVSVTNDGDGTGDAEHEHGEHSHWQNVSLHNAGSIARAFDSGAAQFTPEGGPFQQVGLMIDGPLPENLQYRVKGDDDEWSSPLPIEITWSEGNFHVARIMLEKSAQTVELIGGQGLERLFLEFYDEVRGDPELVTTELPLKSDGESTSEDDGLRTIQQAVAPASLVTSRSGWGARNPNKSCGFNHDPYRMSIHHTSTPADDGGDPAARMRQMQAFHIDSRGWCDIGYHFVVSQSGEVYQGRSASGRSGAHVGGQNTGNVGVSLIGNFDSQVPGAGQLDAAVDIMRWVHQTYSIPLDDTHVKGHQQWPGQSTNCPGTNLRQEIPNLLNRVANKDDGSDSGGSDSGGSDSGGSSDDAPAAQVQFVRPTDGATVSNPATFEVDTSGVTTAQIKADGWPLADSGWNPEQNSTVSYQFAGTGFEREVILYGYDADGSIAATDVIYITVDDDAAPDDESAPDEDPVEPNVKFTHPADGATVPNPATFEIQASGVATVQIKADDWPLADAAWDPQQSTEHSYEFAGTGFEREVVLYGYDSNGAELTQDTIHITVDDAAEEQDDSELGTPLGTFKNTYYHLAEESAHTGPPEATLYAPDCSPIAEVSQDFADSACMEGTAALNDGSVINYYQPCSCGGPCSFCWSEMDEDEFPWGKGSQNNPLEPLYSVAVDTSVIDHGTILYVEEWDGLELPAADGIGGDVHDGCFRADDVGGAISGQHIDLFAGTRTMWLELETEFPSHSEFILYEDSPRCD